MGPYAVEAVGAFQVIGNLGQALHAFFPGDEAAFDAYQQSGYTKSAAAGGDNILVLSGYPIQWMRSRASPEVGSAPSHM